MKKGQGKWMWSFRGGSGGLQVFVRTGLTVYRYLFVFLCPNHLMLGCF